MKFSYSLLKKFVPALPPKNKLVDEFSMKAFEAEEVKGDTIEIKVLNRYSDAASHWGIAREASAIFNIGKKIPEKKLVNIPQNIGAIKVRVSDPEGCPRYMARYFELRKIGPSPAWIKKAIVSCGLRPINAVVDIMNYVMLETGQPLHAFDADKFGREIIVRKASKGEKITTLDNVTYSLDPSTLVIANNKEPLAIAGIKGGKTAEVDRYSRFIIVEAATFSGSMVYVTSRKLGLATDASLRFAHELSPYLAEVGMDRASVLLAEILDARMMDSKDVHKKLPSREMIEFDVAKHNSIIGSDLSVKTVIGYLKRLGFGITMNKKSTDRFIVEVPVLRDDITIFEDLVEEVSRLHGYDKLAPRRPLVGLAPSETDDVIPVKDEIRIILSSLGFFETYNYTFIGKRAAASDFLPVRNSDALEVENPISNDMRLLRSELITGLSGNVDSNEVLQDNLRFFEIGNVWVPKEELHLGLAVHLQSGESLLEIKGVIQTMLERIGIIDFIFTPHRNSLLVESGKAVLGFISAYNRKRSYAELNLGALLKLASSENEFKPLPKYPAVARDLSLVVSDKVKVGDIIDAIGIAGVGDIENIDLIDYLDPTHFTFRIVFRSANRTLTNDEANNKLTQIIKYLSGRFNLKVR